MKILITGAHGFFGRNLTERLEKLANVEILKFGRDDSIEKLEEFVKKADFVFHLAGMNRPKVETEFDKVNKGLTQKLVDLLVQAKRSIPVIYSSSIQVDRDNAYGRSKKAAENLLINYAKNHEGCALIYRLPNIFGKYSRPNYNSAIATFCYNIIRDREISISSRDNKVTLVYIDDVVEEFVNLLDKNHKKGSSSFCKVDVQYIKSLGQIVDTIYDLKKNVISNDADEFTKKLAATFESFRPQ